MAENSTSKESNDLLEDSWMLRPCEVYAEEYKECKSYKGRFHQYYIDGQYKDCTKWKEDMEHCYNHRQTQSFSSYTKIIEHEKERRQERLAKAQANNIWEYRTEPPEDWANPLPEGLGKMKIPSVRQKESLCVIS